MNREGCLLLCPWFPVCVSYFIPQFLFGVNQIPSKVLGQFSSGISYSQQARMSLHQLWLLLPFSVPLYYPHKSRLTLLSILSTMLKKEWELKLEFTIKNSLFLRECEKWASLGTVVLKIQTFIATAM